MNSGAKNGGTDDFWPAVDQGAAALERLPECPHLSCGHGFVLPKLGKTRTAIPQRDLIRTRRQQGFTVVELLITITIILTVSAMAVPNLLSAIDQAKIARAVGDINTIEDGVALYQTINGQLPDNLSQIGYTNFNDPWGNPYQYLNHATMKGNGQARKDRFLVPLNSDYDLYSMGKDGKSQSPLTAHASQDDIVRAADGSYIGLASQF